MRSIAVLALVVAAAILGPARAQQPQPATAQELIATFDGRMAQGERIVAAIGEMYARDQFARQLIIEGFHRNMTAETRQAYIDGTRRHFDRIDQANTRALKRILIFDRGRIIEEGDHHALIGREKGVYRRLFDRQVGGLLVEVG